MNLANRKAELEKELASIQRQIDSCQHDWGEPEYDPETQKVPLVTEMVKQGSDVFFQPTSYKDVQKDRWSQTCKKCGSKRYTTQAKPTGFKPIF